MRQKKGRSNNCTRSKFYQHVEKKQTVQDKDQDKNHPTQNKRHRPKQHNTMRPESSLNNET